MSINYTLIEDQLLMLIESAASDSDLIIRLQHLHRLRKQASKHLRHAERKAAYNARMVYSGADLAEAINMDRKELEYLVKKYLEINPELPRPKRRIRLDISNYIDLSGK